MLYFLVVGELIGILPCAQTEINQVDQYITFSDATVAIVSMIHQAHGRTSDVAVVSFAGGEYTIDNKLSQTNVGSGISIANNGKSIYVNGGLSWKYVNCVSLRQYVKITISEKEPL